MDARAASFWRLADETVEGDIPLRPTRRDKHGQPTGRCVDFALSTVGVPALDRQQTRGPADYDLSYSFSLAKNTRKYREGADRCLPTSLLSAETWEQTWTQHEVEFDQALQASDVNTAWVLLSHAAESLLTRDPHTDAGHLLRAWVVPSRSRPLPSTSSEALQSHPKRRPASPCARTLELQRRPEDPTAAGLWQRVLRDASELGLMDRSSPQAIADDALRRAAKLEVSASQCRVKQWHDAVQNNVHRLRRWVCRTAAPAPGPLDDAPVHPVDIVAAEHAKWGAQWSTPAPHTQAETRDWCARLGPATAPWADELLHPTPAAVLACLRASARRAAGLDAWARPRLRCCRCLSFSF